MAFSRLRVQWVENGREGILHSSNFNELKSSCEFLKQIMGAYRDRHQLGNGLKAP